MGVGRIREPVKLLYIFWSGFCLGLYHVKLSGILLSLSEIAFNILWGHIISVTCMSINITELRSTSDR